jgi:5-methyltetrahydropteroyltriglutamate--homocysteine methyltransferase
VLDLSDAHVESPQVVAERARRAFPYLGPDKLVLAPDCGMKYLPREVADGKLRALTAGAALLRGDGGGGEEQPRRRQG